MCDVAQADLWGSEDLAQRPHERAIDAHQLLHVHLISLVEHHPHLVIMPLQRLDYLQMHSSVRVLYKA